MQYKSLFQFIAPNWLSGLPAGEGKIALTFDDGPDEQTTYLLLEALDKLHIPATFFLTGAKCFGNEKLLRRMKEEGHELANHGFNHESHFYFNAEKQRASIQDTHAILASYNLNPAFLYRPPFGIFNPKTKNVLQSLNYRGVLWSVMIGDWKNSTPQTLWLRMKNKIHDGAIIVLHDGHPTTKNLIPVLHALAEEISSRQWSFVKLDGEIISLQNGSSKVTHSQMQELL